MVSPGSSPALAAVSVASNDVYVYVKVENNGTVDFGACPCAVPLPAVWPTVPFLSGYRAAPPTSGSVTDTGAGTTLTMTPTSDTLTGPGLNVSLPFSAKQRAWGWSPDGRFFAHVSSPNGPDWSLEIVALAAITRPNGTTLAKGQVAFNGSGLFSAAWNNSNFGWAHSTAVVAAGPSAVGSGSKTFDLACPLAPAFTPAANALLLNSAGQVDYVFVFSPCGGFVAILPKVLNSAAGPQQVQLFSTTTAQSAQFKKNNVPTPVMITGLNPSITTKQHAANGVSIATGSGTTTVDADDPECTMVGGGVLAWVDRVKASTLPSANLGVMAVGGSVASTIKAGNSAWVQVPPPTGWANQGEQHWCLLAQAYTADGTTIPRPWNGQAPTPLPFPVTKDNCAQRNIMIA